MAPPSTPESGPGVIAAVHVGRPVPVIHGPAVVPTAIFKTRVDGPTRMNEDGLEGDQQSDLRVHGGIDKAVYVYRLEDYRWWTEHDLPTAPGLFGENLSLQGGAFADWDVCIGDQYRLGRDAVGLVTGPREPCFKLGIRVGDPDFPQRFREAGRLGFYLRILAPGVVSPGDRFELLERPATTVTVRHVHLAYVGVRADRASLEDVLAAPGIAARWHAVLGPSLQRARATTPSTD